ncbi:MAG TPA: cupredoxin domain-containing protein [Actinomycetota bacterium]|nr:cupredoxin domain-containing protein [Actinomycetota bacterium]
MEDRGTAEASGGTLALDASEFAFAPTCVESGAGETLEVTVTNTGSALHNLTIESLGIDEDVQAGRTITVQVKLPASGSVPFFCKYHVANGMQGAFLIG